MENSKDKQSLENIGLGLNATEPDMPGGENLLLQLVKD